MPTSPRIEDLEIWNQPESQDQTSALLGISRRTPQGQEGPDINNLEPVENAGPSLERPNIADLEVWNEPKKPELTAGRLAGAAYEGLKDLPRSLWQAGRGVSEALLGEESPVSKYITEVSEAPAIAPKEEYNVSSGWLEDFSRAMPQMASQMLLWGAAAPLGVAAKAGGLLAKVPQIIGGAQGLPGMAYMVAQIAGGQYDSLRKQGVEPKRAAIAAFANGIMQAPLEQIGITKFAKLWKPQKDIIQKLKNIAEVTGTEWLTEFLQQYPESATNIFAMNPDKTALEKVGKFIDDIWETTKEGAYQGTLTAPWALLGAGGGLAKPKVGEPGSTKPPFTIDQIKQAYQNKEITSEHIQAYATRFPEMKTDLDDIVYSGIIDRVAAGEDPNKVLMEESPEKLVAAQTEALTRSGGELLSETPATREEPGVIPSKVVEGTRTPYMGPTNLETLKGILYGKQGRVVETPAEVTPQPVVEPTIAQQAPVEAQVPGEEGKAEFYVKELPDGTFAVERRGGIPTTVEAFTREQAQKSADELNKEHAELFGKEPPEPALPEAKGKEAVIPDFTIQGRWDSSKLGKKIEWAKKGGWVTSNGQFTKLGEKIVESQWSDLSPAAQNVLKDHILADYPGLAKQAKPIFNEGVFGESVLTGEGKPVKQLGGRKLTDEELISGKGEKAAGEGKGKEGGIDTLIKKYEATGRTAFRYPLKKEISVDGRTMPEKEAVAKMRGVVEVQPTEKGKAPAADRISQIKSELARLQTQYEKKMAVQQKKGAIVPPSIKASALKGIASRMDKLDAELARLEEAKKAPEVKLESLTVTVKAIAPDGTVHELKGQNAKAAIDEVTAKHDVFSKILECLSA